MADLKSGFAPAQWLGRLVPATLFGRLALLLFVAVLTSHVMALTLMFELNPRPPEAYPHAGPPGGTPPMSFLGLWLDIGIRLSALMLAAWIGARWLSQPMLRLATAAQALGKDIAGPPLVEEGTRECRETTRVFNQMQAQIRQQLDERDSFVAAVSHDLRTPLTRLTLRAESLTDPEQKRRFSEDLAEMDTMITATLDYLRGAADPEPFVLLDVPSLLESLADDGQEAGHSVTLVTTDGPSCAPLKAQASALRRAIGNLVDNAVRYGGSAEIAWCASAHELRIDVMDRGPGIPEAERAKVFAPFYRLEGSRHRSSGGVGLGLTIAHDIAVRQKGHLTLSERPGGGLVASLTLPR